MYFIVNVKLAFISLAAISTEPKYLGLLKIDSISSHGLKFQFQLCFCFSVPMKKWQWLISPTLCCCCLSPRTSWFETECFGAHSQVSCSLCRCMVPVIIISMQHTLPHSDGLFLHVRARSKWNQEKLFRGKQDLILFNDLRVGTLIQTRNCLWISANAQIKCLHFSWLN